MNAWQQLEVKAGEWPLMYETTYFLITHGSGLKSLVSTTPALHQARRVAVRDNSLKLSARMGYKRELLSDLGRESFLFGE